MLAVFSPIFVTDTKIIFRYDFVTSLKYFKKFIYNFKGKDKLGSCSVKVQK